MVSRVARLSADDHHSRRDQTLINPKDPWRDLAILQWQSNTSSFPTRRPGSVAGRSSKNHVLENIRRVKEYQRLSQHRRRLPAYQPSTPRVVTPRPSTLKQSMPPRPSTAVSHCYRSYRDTPHYKQNINDSSSEAGVGDTCGCTTALLTDCSVCSDGSPVHRDLPHNSISRVFPSPQRSAITHKRQKSRTNTQAVQTGPAGELVVAQTQETLREDDSNGNKAPANSVTGMLHQQSDEQNRLLRHTTDSGKYEFMRAYAGTVLDDWKLKLLGDTPLEKISWKPRPELLTVPKASIAKKVNLIRRDINFVRANAHMAGFGISKRSVSKHRPVPAETENVRNLNTAGNAAPIVTTPVPAAPNSNLWVDSESKVAMYPQRRLRVGGIPNYIIKWRQRQMDKSAQETANRLDPDRPPNYKLMPDEERVSTLDLLRRAHEELSTEWSHLPIRQDTMRIRNRRSDLEQRLSELEEAIGIFKKPRVFIRPD